MRKRLWVCAGAVGLLVLPSVVQGQDVTTLLTQFLSGLRNGFVTFGNKTADPSTTLEGSLYYNSTSHAFKFYNGTSFTTLGGTVGGSTTDVQCNISSAFAACDTGNLTYNQGTNTLNASKVAATQVATSVGLLDGNSNAIVSMTAPTVSAGFGTSPTVTTGSRAAAFEVTVGSSPGTTGTVALPTATTGWVCTLQNMTAAIVIRQTARSTTSATFTLASTPTVGDKLVGQCLGF